MEVHHVILIVLAVVIGIFLLHRCEKKLKEKFLPSLNYNNIANYPYYPLYNQAVYYGQYNPNPRFTVDTREGLFPLYPSGLDVPSRTPWYIPVHQNLDMGMNGIPREVLERSTCRVPSSTSEYCVHMHGGDPNAIAKCTVPGSISEGCW